MNRVLVDTGVWYAIFDPRDAQALRYPKSVKKLSSLVETSSVVVPWPTVYETLCTSFVRKNLSLRQFERRLKAPNITFVEDEPYRDEAFTLSIQSSLRRNRTLSMVDCVLRLMLDDVKMRISYLATYNDGDFVDVCRRRNIELIGRIV